MMPVKQKFADWLADSSLSLQVLGQVLPRSLQLFLFGIYLWKSPEYLHESGVSESAGELTIWWWHPWQLLGNLRWCLIPSTEERELKEQSKLWTTGETLGDWNG